jgi:hypothetical protein
MYLKTAQLPDENCIPTLRPSLRWCNTYNMTYFHSPTPHAVLNVTVMDPQGKDPFPHINRLIEVILMNPYDDECTIEFECLHHPLPFINPAPGTKPLVWSSNLVSSDIYPLFMNRPMPERPASDKDASLQHGMFNLPSVRRHETNVLPRAPLTLNRSPHGNKTARDQYVGQVYKTASVIVYVPMPLSTRRHNKCLHTPLLDYIIHTCHDFPTVMSTRVQYSEMGPVKRQH